MERKDPRDKPRCRQPTNAGPTDSPAFQLRVAVSDRRQLDSAPSWQRHLRHDPTVETLRDRGLRFAATARTLDRETLIATLLRVAASGMCTSIKGDGHTAIAATSRTANPASPLRMDWTNNSRSATGKEWGWCDENARNTRSRHADLLAMTSTTSLARICLFPPRPQLGRPLPKYHRLRILHFPTLGPACVLLR
jgi:hypothetical protein